MSFPFRNRLKNIFGAQSSPNTSYDITNEFLTKILPLIQSGRLADNNQNRINTTQQNMFPLGGQRRAPIKEEPIIDMGKFMPESKPLNVQYGGMNPYQEGLLRLREQELGLNREKLAATTGLGQQKLEVAKFKAENPNLRIVDNKQGALLAINPITGEVVSQWDSGTMSMEDKIALTQEGALDRIAATGRERIGQINRQGEIGNEQIALRGAEARETKETIPGRAPVEPKPDTATLIKTKAQQKYNKVINEHPEWRSYISLDESGFPVVAEVGSGTWLSGGDLDKDTRDKIIGALGLGGEEETTESTKPATKKPDPLGIRK